MKIYVASRTENRPAAKKFKEELEKLGYEVTSEWLSVEDKWFTAESQGKITEYQKGKFANRDLGDIDKAHLVIFLLDCDTDNMRGGVHVEFGYAIGINRPCWIVGERPTIFHYYYNGQIIHMKSSDEALEKLKVMRDIFLTHFKCHNTEEVSN